MSLPITTPPQLINDYLFSDHVFNCHRIRIISSPSTIQRYVVLSDLTELLEINFDSVLIQQLNNELFNLKQFLELDSIEDSMLFDSPQIFDELMLTVIDVEDEIKNVIHLTAVDLVLKKSKSAIVPKFRDWLINEILPKYQKTSAVDSKEQHHFSELLSESNSLDVTPVAQLFSVYQALINQYDLVINHAPLSCKDIIAINLANIYLLAKTYQLPMPSKEELLKSFDGFFITNKAFPYKLISANAKIKSPLWHKHVNCVLFQLSENNR